MKVILFGYYGFRNVGDEQLLDETVRLLKESLPDVKYMVASGPKPLPFQTFSRWNFIAWMFNLIGAKAVIFGGGSIFQSKTSVFSLLFYLMIVQLARFCKTDVVLLSHGFGPFRAPIHQRLAQWILMQPHVVRSWRDDVAKELFGAKTDVVFPDLTLLQQRKAPIQPLNGGDFTIGISFIDSTFAEHISLPSNITVQIIQNQPKHSIQNKSGILLEDVWDSVIPIHLLVTQRYHSAIWASKFGIPWLAVSEDPKLVALADNCGAPIISDSDNISERILQLVKQYPEPIRDHKLMDWYDSHQQYRHKVLGWLYEHVSR